MISSACRKTRILRVEFCAATRIELVARLGGGRSVALRLESFVLHVLLEFGYLSQKRIPQLAATLRYAGSESMIEGGALSRNVWSSILR
jgi:hypothetical protein